MHLPNTEIVAQRDSCGWCIRNNALTCAPSGFRTPDPLIKSQLLYQLS
ncbi:hypothetical protein BTB1458_2800 [Mycobacterium tuberculosis]|nr:hypothetical protein BTB1458_2800 [Mycobacterium tuberculosis]BAQ06632.1 hypothetical protein KURONO_2845 [Mycobacterium tuberculosis str. Kurono]